MGSVTHSINIGVTSVQKYINSMQKQRNSTVIKRMCNSWNQALFSSSYWALGTRLVCSCSDLPFK